MEQNNENQISSVAIYSYHSETNIGIALRAVLCNIGFLTAAIVAVGIPTATFDNMQSVSIGRGSPFQSQCRHRHPCFARMHPQLSIHVPHDRNSWKHPWACVRRQVPILLRRAGDNRAWYLLQRASCSRLRHP